MHVIMIVLHVVSGVISAVNQNWSAALWCLSSFVWYLNAVR
jgi:hypothetical protein